MPVRVYYEDTDAGGIVYYANWLRYFERARTDWLRALGFGHRALAADHGILLVVRDICLDYQRPARLDDELLIDVEPLAVQRASCTLRQTARQIGADEILVTAQLRFAAIRQADGRATGFPKPLRDAILQTLPEAAADVPGGNRLPDGPRIDPGLSFAHPAAGRTS